MRTPFVAALLSASIAWTPLSIAARSARAGEDRLHVAEPRPVQRDATRPVQRDESGRRLDQHRSVGVPAPRHRAGLGCPEC